MEIVFVTDWLIMQKQAHADIFLHMGKDAGAAHFFAMLGPRIHAAKKKKPPKKEAPLIYEPDVTLAIRHDAITGSISGIILAHVAR